MGCASSSGSGGAADARLEDSIPEAPRPDEPNDAIPSETPDLLTRVWLPSGNDDPSGKTPQDAAAPFNQPFKFFVGGPNGADGVSNEQLLPKPKAAPKRNPKRKVGQCPLADFFEGSYLKSGDFEHEQFVSKFDEETKEMVYVHKGTGIKVWTDVLDLSGSSTHRRALFHYTSPVGFTTLTDPGKSCREIYDFLVGLGALFGQGAYTTSKGPAEFGSRENVLENSYYAQFKEDDDKGLSRSDDRHRMMKWAMRADFCVPILAAERDACDVRVQETLEMVHGPGKTITGEPLELGRDVWVVQAKRPEDKLRQGRKLLLNLRQQRWTRLQESLSPEHLSTLQAQSLYAASLMRQGETPDERSKKREEAKELQTEILKALERLNGKDHPQALVAKTDLALTLAKLGDKNSWDESHKLQEEVLETSVKVWGQEHAQSIRAKAELASILLEGGDVDQFKLRQREVIDARKRLGDHHPDFLQAKATLAEVELKELLDSSEPSQVSYQDIRFLQTDLVDAKDRLLGPEHPLTLTAKAALSVTFFEEGNLDECRHLQASVMEGAEMLLGRDHPEALTAKANLAVTLFEQGNLAESRRLQTEVVNARVQRLGPDHPDALTAKSNLAATILEIGSSREDLLEAKGLQKEVLQVREAQLSRDHPDCLAAQANLACTVHELGELEEARRLQDEVLKATIEILGMDHPQAITVKANLAITVRDMGDWNEAKRLQEEVIEAKAAALGEDHPHTLTARANLVATIAQSGDLDTAKDLQIQLLQATVAAEEKAAKETGQETHHQSDKAKAVLQAIEEKLQAQQGMAATVTKALGFGRRGLANAVGATQAVAGHLLPGQSPRQESPTQ